METTREKTPRVPRARESWDYPTLIGAFEHDMIDAHKVEVKFSMSEAGAELITRGKDALKPIVEFFRQKIPISALELDIAWCMLLGKIREGINPQPPAPQNTKSIREWYAWAQKYAQI
jgi:hypothetical protein